MAQAPPSFPLPSDLELAPSPEVGRTLALAAWVGEAAGSDVSVDYTALFVALAWSDGEAGRWLSSMGGLDLDPVLAHIGLKPDDREEILSRAMGGSTPTLQSDVVSVSARQILQEAASLARETGGDADGSVEVHERHLLGAYFFRNPPGHDIHLWREWGLDQASWRREFARFVEATAPPGEVPRWRAVFGPLPGGDGDTDSGEPGVDPELLRSYRADPPARRVLETMEEAAVAGPPEGYLVQEGEEGSDGFSFGRMVTSAHLARGLLAVASQEPELEPLSRWWAERVGADSRPPAKGKAADAPLDEELARLVGSLPGPWEGPAEEQRQAPEGEGGPSDLPGEASRLGRRGIPLSHELWAVLTRARTLAREASGREPVSIRHLMAVLLVEEEPAGHRMLDAAGAPLLALRAAFLTRWSRNHLSDDAGAWRAYLVGRVPPTVARFDADNADAGEDQLDVTRYATAFATLMVAESVAPPLSIGVFGDWGSGKSFFMRLMRDQARRLAAMDVTGPDGERLFHRNVVPILFNAWHYVDANLWASLVQAILQGLHDAMAGTPDERLLDEVLDRLELAQEAKAQAAAEVERAEQELASRRSEVESAREEMEEQAGELEEARKADVSDRLRTQVVEGLSLKGLREFATAYAGLPEREAAALEKLQEAGEHRLGELKEVVEEGRATLLRGRSTLEWLVRAPLTRGQVLALGGVVLAGGLAVWGLDAWIESQVPAVTAALVELGAAVGMVVAWVRGHLRSVGQGLDHLERVRARVEEEEAAVLAEHARDMAEAQGRVEEAERVLAARQDRLQEARDRLAEAHRELRESGSVRRIARLVERRLEGGDYERHLGIVSAIRNDFDTISRYMEQRSREAEDDPELRPVDRIVLYIDDLDRCPTDKVVSVLEAIHLLLAFKLFVVVVGVDIRWAARSLQERYPQHLRGSRFEVTPDGDGSVSVVPEGATALDYLEKIFQVPFWLPPMDEDASRSMINALVPTPTDDGEPGKGAVGGSGAPADRGTADGAEGSSSPDEELVAAIDAADGEAGTGAAAGGGEGAGSVQGPSGEEEAARLLSVSRAERDLMLRLGSAVGKSPRRLKRFVNTYRILKASLDALDRRRFVDAAGSRGGGEFGAAMALLALLTGAPRVGIDVLHALRTLEDDAPLADLEALLVEDAHALEQGYARAALATYRSWTGLDEPTVEQLRDWAPEVARFSFRSGRL